VFVAGEREVIMLKSTCCPQCGSFDVISVTREKHSGRALFVTELVYLCPLGHMFTRSEAKKMEEMQEADSLRTSA